MQPLAPPPSTDTGALTYPRTLLRWLDDNPVTPLTRTQAYITLPTFSQAVTWAGYSTLVAAFNYEGPNNFSLKALSGLPSSPNYLLCIMWVDEDNVTHRYAIWTDVGEVMPFDLVQYDHQLIKKNFRFEIWSANSTPAVQSSTLTFYTSVLGGVDYRYGSDFVLVSADAEVTAFGVGLSLPSAGTILVVGSGFSGSTGLYIQMNGSYNGMNIYYNGAQSSPGSSVPTNGIWMIFYSGAAWYITNAGSAGYGYQSTAPVAPATPDLVTTWINTQSPTGNPVPSSVTATTAFALPLIFPDNAAPTINT